MPQELPLPPHFNPARVGEVWRVAYQELAEAAENWAIVHAIQPAYTDRLKVCLVTVDVQNTFCIPGFELYVGGRSGTGAVNDNRRLCGFIYRNLHRITNIVSTLDTHQAIQIFHSLFLINNEGKHPAPFTQITVKDVEEGHWKFNPAVSHRLQISPEYGQRHLLYYVKQLRESGKYDLTVWPYHSMLGGIGHALVSAVEEAIFFHTMARTTQPDYHIKGEHPLTEHYSVLGPEIATDPDGKRLTQKTDKLFHTLMHNDAVIITGQAKSHCVAWSVADLLEDVKTHPHFVRKVYLLEDCTSPVVVPGVIDYTDEAEAAFRRFAEAGMHIVRSTEPITHWPDLEDRIINHT
jgi:nicotinamidase-related amidase